MPWWLSSALFCYQMPIPAVGSVLPSVPSPPVCKRTDQSHLPQDIPHLSFSHPYDARIPCGQFHQRPPSPHTAMGRSSADVQPALSTGKHWAYAALTDVEPLPGPSESCSFGHGSSSPRNPPNLLKTFLRSSNWGLRPGLAGALSSYSGQHEAHAFCVCAVCTFRVTWL